ncbi:MAG TPA: 4'-phosphopantetheinyl transferase superfamily protein [Nitrospira sp.]|nr:4'-phosphopantetheinyl transferase superfamily protein [Nitrospira sp.]
MTLDRFASRPNPVISFISCESLASDVEVRIAAPDIHVWSAGLDAAAPCLDRFHRWLDGAERSRAIRFVQERDRRRYILAHGTLRAVLSRYLGCRPDTLQFEREANGKPFLVVDDTRTRLAFSMTHSDDRMLIAVAREDPIGIDLEQIRPTVPVVKLAERFYRPAESARIRMLPREEQVVQFYRYWVAKEAALKGQGMGLSSLHDCEVCHSLPTQQTEVRIDTGSAAPAKWRVQWLACGTGWAGAVAFQGEGTVRVMSPDKT